MPHLVFLACAAAATGCIAAAAPAGTVRIFEHAGRVSRMYGPDLARGASPVASAEAFLRAHAATLGVDRADLAAAGPFADGRHLQPIMPDPATGAFKFTGVYFRHERDGVPVFRSRVMLLARNAADHPIVLVANGLRPIGVFRPAARGAVDAERVVRALAPALVRFTAPDTVIFAGAGAGAEPPVLARVLTGESADAASPDYAKRLFVIDAGTGAVLYSEDQVHRVDVEGNVSGLATEGLGPDVCGPEDAAALPYARLTIDGGGVEAFADGKGDFVIPYEGQDPVAVTSSVRGRWFRVSNRGGPDAELQLEVTPPGPANFLHNAENADEFARAEVNAYVHANVIRDFALDQNPEYPTIASQAEFTVNVNLAATCGAHYSGDAISFLRAGACANAAYSTVVYHEYGHHLVATAGSGQGAYGEGMGDAMGVLITDDPGLAYGFVGACDAPLRTADNGVTYPCDGPIHDCGTLLSGCVWSVRGELAATRPETYREILARLAVNAILLHVGDAITPAITIDYLTLDDDDGDLSNGTPHYCEIAAGFGAHAMDAPALECDADIDGSGTIDFDDLLRVLGAWGPCEDCPEDLDNDDEVGFGDLLLLLAAWGDCGC